MIRPSLVALLLLGSLITALPTNATTTPQPEQENNHTQAATERPVYQFGNKADEPCILMEMDAYVAIKWEVAPNETKEMDMFLEPSKVLTSGSCNEDEANLSLTWKSFHLRWNFAKTRDWAKWFAKQVELQYDRSGLDNKVVNGTTGMSTMSTQGSSEVMMFSAPMGKAYHCPYEYELELNGSVGDSANLRLRNFRVQPFLAKPTFGPSYCPTNSAGVGVMSTTDSPGSSGSSALGVTKTDNSSPMDTSIHTNIASATPMNTTTPAFTSPSRQSSRPLSDNFTATSTSSTKMVMSSGSPAVPTHEEVLSTTARPPVTIEPTTYGVPVGTTMPPYAYQKAFPNVIKMPFYPPKKVFFAGVKMDDNEALSAMLWSWYTSGFYTGYYQAQQQSKKMH